MCVSLSAATTPKGFNEAPAFLPGETARVPETYIKRILLQ